MGISLCSCSDIPSKPEVEKYEELSESSPSLEEEEEDDSAVFLTRAQTMPARYGSKISKLQRPSSVAVSKSNPEFSDGRSSLRQRIEQRSNNPKPFITGEREAKLYAEAVERDTLKHVGNTLRIAQGIVQKSDDITEELVRQGDVICTVNKDIHDTEQVVNQTNHTLKGMKSIRGKVGNMLWRKKPEVQAYEGFQDNRGSKIKNRRCVSAPVQMQNDMSPGGTNQQQIKGGLTQLNLVMDTIKTRQMDITDEIKRQDKQLGAFSNNMGRTQEKIKVQTDLMSSMRKG